MGKLYVDQVLKIAAGEIGYREKATNAELDSQTANAGSGNYTKYARDLWEALPHFYQGPKNGYDWCAVFFDWCLYMACGDSQHAQDALCYTGPYGAGCGMSVMYYREAGRFWKRADADPRPGDQIFFGSESNVQHTGLVEAVSADTITTIEGNSSNMVRRVIYNRTNSRIYGYGRPKYDGDVAPDPSTDIPFTDVKPNQWYTDAAVWCWENGIVSGRTPTYLGVMENVTKGEVMVMLQKLYELIKGGG